MTTDIQKCPKIEFEKVSMEFLAKNGCICAIEDINLLIKENEILCILGPSGCGKSTLINLIAGFIMPSKGKVKVDGERVIKPGADRAVVFQPDSVFPWLSVYKNLEYGPKARGVQEKDRTAIVEKFLELVGLVQFRDSFPHQLSGGMKKRVDLARAYANNPNVLLMDEPFGALDVLTKEKMQIELLNLWNQEARTIVFITHDIEEAIFIGNRIAIMSPRPGKIDKEINIPFDKRSINTRIKTTPEFQKIRQEIIDKLN